MNLFESMISIRDVRNTQGRSQVFIVGGGASWGYMNLSIKALLWNFKIEKIVLLIFKIFKMFCKLFINISIILESFASF